MSKKRKKYSPEQKVKILKKLLIDWNPYCEQTFLGETKFYRNHYFPQLSFSIYVASSFKKNLISLEK